MTKTLLAQLLAYLLLFVLAVLFRLRSSPRK
jgi:hypothetical protein